VGEKYARGLRLRIDDSLIGEVVQTGEPLRVSSPEDRLELKLKTGYLVSSLLYVPLKLRDEIKGVLGVSNRVSDRAFTAADQHRLNILADHAVIALENARLYEAEQKRAFQLAMTSHLSQRITSILDVDGLSLEVVELLKQNLGYYYAQILLRDDPGHLAMQEGSGEAGQSIKDTQLRVHVDDQTIVGWVANHGESLCVNNVGQEPRYRPYELLPDTRAELGVPLRVGGEVIGVLDIHSDETGAFDEDDQTMLQILGDQVAVAIQNARSYERAHAQAEELNTLNQMATAMPSDALRSALASAARSASEPLKAFATDTYALKAGVRQGTISCSDDSLTQTLDSLELRIEQMASLTEILKKLSSPDSTAEDWGKLEQKLESLNDRYAS
jgi:GAF domain-containing protein